MPDFNIPSDAKVSKFALGETLRKSNKLAGVRLTDTTTTSRNGQNMVTRVRGTAPNQKAIEELERILEGSNEA